MAFESVSAGLAERQRGKVRWEPPSSGTERGESQPHRPLQMNPPLADPYEGHAKRVEGAMTEDTKAKPKPSLAKRAAMFSVVAPGIAVLVNVVTISARQNSQAGKLAIGIVGLSLIVAGFICAVIGLCSIRKHGRKGILGRSITGLLINGFVIASALLLMAPILQQRMQPRFTVAMPSAYADFPAGMQQPNVSHSFIKGDPTDETPDIVCFVESLGGTIGKDTDLSGFVASRPNVTLLEEEWKGHPIDVCRIQESFQGRRFLTFNAQVPVLPQAVQVKITGPMERENELRQDLRAVLAGIDGPTNW